MNNILLVKQIITRRMNKKKVLFETLLDGWAHLILTQPLGQAPPLSSFGAGLWHVLGTLGEQLAGAPVQSPGSLAMGDFGKLFEPLNFNFLIRKKKTTSI